MSEANFARDVMEDRYLTEGRSLVLASDIHRLEEEPLANAYNLKSALKSVGGLLDPAEDVLFLFLTSHGSADGSIEVSLYPFRMRALDSRDLREALDAAGIQWRIIVVSACYSASFFDALADDKTLILSAAAADKTSFGCSSERELTYFGEAFLRDALENENDIVEAFHTAKASIGQREILEDLQASDPQIYVGKEINAKLAELVTAPDLP